MNKRIKYPPEMIEKWAKDLKSGMVTKEGIMARSGIGRVDLNKRIRIYNSNEQKD